MNSSVVSVYDNVSTAGDLSKSFVYSTINDLLNLNTEQEVRIFCPLCVNSFSVKFSLFEHLRQFHNGFLTQARNQTLKFKECPFCNSKFYGKHLTAKHVLHYHYRIIKKLFVFKNKFKCAFCNVKLSKRNCSSNVKHIESLHFLDFVEELKKMFLDDTVQEMSLSEALNSTEEDSNSQVINWRDVCVNFGSDSSTKTNSRIKNFDEASKLNCYDFTDLKQQLENLRDSRSKEKSALKSPNKSILKDLSNVKPPLKSARRVLRFDLPSDDEDKENLIFNQNCYNVKQISLDECSLLCNDNKTHKTPVPNSITYGEPQHCSTPNSKFPSTVPNDKEIDTHYFKSNFKSEKLIKKPRNKMKMLEKQGNEFEFQCGKCRLLFRENFELVCHIKNTHKKFGLNALQPGYHCAICDARFYKNRYLKKHHNLHKPY